MSGRKKKSGLKSSINPQREEMTDIRGKLRYGHCEWRMVRLQESLGQETKKLREKTSKDDKLPP